MTDYKLTTQKSWSTTQKELAFEFEKWGVTEWDTNYPRGARSEAWSQSLEDRTVTLTYKKNGQTINLKMGKQARAVDNLRVLYIAINTIRMNERRGVGEVLKSAYIQINATAGMGEGKVIIQRNPYDVLDVKSGTPLSVCEAMYKEKVKRIHPDVGGSENQMKELNEAIEKIRSNQ